MRPFKGFKVYTYTYFVLTVQLQVVVRSHFYLQKPFGIVLKSRCPMLELSQGKKNSQLLMDNGLNIAH